MVIPCVLKGNVRATVVCAIYVFKYTSYLFSRLDLACEWQDSFCDDQCLFAFRYLVRELLKAIVLTAVM